MRKALLALLTALGAAAAWSLLRRRGGAEGPDAAPVPTAPAREERAPAQPAAPVEPAPAATDGEPAEGYCVKERKKVQIKDPTRTTTKNGRPALTGTCPDCGTKIFRFLPQS